MKPEHFKAQAFYSVRDAKARFFPSRSESWLRSAIKAGWFGDCVCDGGGWLIPESGILAYLSHHRVLVGQPGRKRNNLAHFNSEQ